MTALPTPNLQGFAAAQDYLRGKFGRDVQFYGPAQIVYDPSIPASAFDDEGIPLDPLAPSTETSANVELPDLRLVGVVHANVVFRPLQTSIMRRDETYETPLGMRAGLNKDLIIAPADLAIATSSTHFMIGTIGANGAWTPEDGELWKIANIKADSFGTVERVIVYGEGTR